MSTANPIPRGHRDQPEEAPTAGSAPSPVVVRKAVDHPLREPRRLLARMLADAWRSRWLSAELLRRNLRKEYRQSALGLLLAFVPALVTAAWCTLVRHTRVIDAPELEIPYPAFVLLSMMLWTTFVEALYAPIFGLAEELPTLARASFPAEAIVVARAGEVLFNFLVKLVLIVAAVVWFQLPIASTVWLAPLGVLLLVVLGLGLGLWLAPLNALFRDIGRGLQAVTTIWLFLTPIFFPTPATGWAALVVRLNPVTPILTATRDWVTTARLHDPWGLVLMSLVAGLLFVSGAVFYRVSVPVVLDRTNA